LIIAATGHRPDKLGGYSEATNERLRLTAMAFLKNTKGVKAGISGMAQGWDLAWAEVLLKQGIPLIAAVPFEGQHTVWPAPAQERYRSILARAAEVKIVNPGVYASWKMQARNKWMVDQSDHLVALWDGSKGGTCNCVSYAVARKRPMTNVWDRFLSLGAPSNGRQHGVSP
jgi:uncharacterized phage-like protein YoqJ